VTTTRKTWARWPLGHAADRTDPTQQPLLSDKEIVELLYRVQSLPDRQAEHRRPVQHMKAGDSHSTHRGSGLDYEESRRYQAGDDLRFMDWRLTARSGEPYMKVFREVKQPSVFVLVDRRSTMRFGTRQRLKAAQAANVAALCGFAAVRRGAAVGGVLVQPELRWLDERSGESGAHALIRGAAAPCPLLAGGDNEPSLGKVLCQVQAMLTPGTELVLISDFWDLAETDQPCLFHLATQQDVFAVQVLDPAELSLPNAGLLHLRSVESGMSARINSADPGLRAGYEKAVQDQLQQRQHWLTAAGITVQRLMTDHDPVQALAEAMF
jgi:uncharacterized protein (DUF58 family)